MRKKIAGTAAPDSPEAINARVEELEKKMERLRALYEGFFAGRDRRPPNVPRRELNRLMLEMQQIQIRNASVRFRFQGLLQKWTLLTTYWNRTLREIEAGTYLKDLARVQRRLAQKGAPLTEEEVVALGIPAGRARALVERQQRQLGQAPDAAERPAPPSAAPAASPADTGHEWDDEPTDVSPEIPGITESELSDLYGRYQAAAREIAGDVRPASPDSFREMLRKSVSSLIERHGSGPLALDVAVRDGRVVLKARRAK